MTCEKETQEERRDRIAGEQKHHPGPFRLEEDEDGPVWNILDAEGENVGEVYIPDVAFSRPEMVRAESTALLLERAPLLLAELLMTRIGSCWCMSWIGVRATHTPSCLRRQALVEGIEADYANPPIEGKPWTVHIDIKTPDIEIKE